MLLYVVESKGSSPGRQGFFMAVNASGEMEGSIGGGIMEHKFTELAREKLQQQEAAFSIRRQVHDKEAPRDQSGMICSGEQTLLLYPVRKEDEAAIEAIIRCLQSDGVGELQFSVEGMGFLERIPEIPFYFHRSSEDEWRYTEKIGRNHRCLIVGSGHCGLALSQLMRSLDFHITVFEHRPSLSTLLRNEYADCKILVSDYSELGSLLPDRGENRYLVVMTQGYRTDDQAVRTLLNKDFRYFGLLGSKAKIGTMMEAYRSEGMEEDKLRRIHAPAGLPIHSQTPEEIAISIAAEIIQERGRGGF